jgi:hypothetical protein
VRVGCDQMWCIQWKTKKNDKNVAIKQILNTLIDNKMSYIDRQGRDIASLL